MAITYTFSISSEKPSDMYVTLGMSKYIVKHPSLGKFNFIKCSFTIIRDKINNVSIVITPYSLRTEEEWFRDIEYIKIEIIKLINKFVAKYNERGGLISAIQFDTDILTLTETMKLQKLKDISCMVEKHTCNNIWINLMFKKSKAKLTK